MSESIKRAARPESDFYILRNSIAADSRLTWAARGVLIYLLTRPDNWRVSVAHLQKQTAHARKQTGRDGMYAILRELECVGYIVREEKRDSEGRIKGVEYIVCEVPDERESFELAPIEETKKPKRKTQAATTIPENFPSAELIAQSKREYPALDVEREAQSFVNYWESAPLSKARKRNWERVWANWLLNATKYQRPNDTQHARTAADRRLN